MSKISSTVFRMGVSDKGLIQSMQKVAASIKSLNEQLAQLQVTELQQKVVAELFAPHEIGVIGSGYGAVLVAWRSQTFTVAYNGKYLHFDEQKVPLDAANFDDLFTEAVAALKKKLTLTKGLR